MPNKMNRACAEIADDIYLAYVGALSATPDADLADFVAEYAAPCSDAAPCDNVKRRISSQLRTRRKGSSRAPRRHLAFLASIVNE